MFQAQDTLTFLSHVSMLFREVLLTQKLASG